MIYGQIMYVTGRTRAGRDTLCLTWTVPVPPAMEKNVKGSGQSHPRPGKRNTNHKALRPWAYCSPFVHGGQHRPVGSEPSLGPARQRLDFILWSLGVKLKSCRGRRQVLNSDLQLTLTGSLFSACHPGCAPGMLSVLEGKFLSSEDANLWARVFIFLCRILAIFRFSFLELYCC